MIPAIGEINFGQYLSKRLLPLTIGIGLLISLFFPATYYFLEYSIMQHSAAIYADRFTKSMHDLVLQSETLWKYQTYEYRSIIDHLPPEKEMNLKVLDASGKPITDYLHSNYKPNRFLDFWAPTASAPIRFNNRTVGTVVVSLSQEELIARTFLIFILSLCVGSALAGLAYFFPVGIVTTLGTRIENLINNLHTATEESKALQLEAEQSEQRFRELVQGLDAMVWEADARDWRFSFVSRQAESILGYPVQRWLDEPGFWQNHLFLEDREQIIDLYRSGFHSGSSFQVEHRMKAVDDRPMWIRNMVSIVHDNQAAVRFRGVIVDITRQKLAEEAIAAEKERLAVTLRSIGDGVVTTDTEGNIITLNIVAERLTGWKQEQAVGTPLHTVFRIVDDKNRLPRENPVGAVVQTKSIFEFAEDTILIADDGAERIIELSAAPIFSSRSDIIGVVIAFRDVTEKRRMAQDLLKTQQLESLGILAGGIAHDFNNLLTGILGNISLAMMFLEPHSQPHQKLMEAEKAYERARDLTQSLLTFSKGGTPKKKTMSIGQLIVDSANFTLSGSNVRCNFSIPADLWLVDVDEGQMSQVINNLIINADQAMPDGGMIDVSVENVTIGAEEMAPLPPGRYVRISLADHGDGIPERNLQKIFDPYFTTKKNGNGLGLAMVHSIIRHHGGHIRAQSTLGMGTTFTMHLQASDNDTLEAKESTSLSAIGHGRILIMDDEEVIRQVACEILGQLGYRAESCCDGQKAIECYCQALQAGDPFDAVIMDLTIPGGMGGKLAVKKLLEIDPMAKTIVSSGYSNDPIIAYYDEYGFKGCIIKPYRVEEFHETLWSVLHPS